MAASQKEWRFWRPIAKICVGIAISVLLLVMGFEVVVVPRVRNHVAAKRAEADCRAIIAADRTFKIVYQRRPASFGELANPPPPPATGGALKHAEDCLTEVPIDPRGSSYTYSIEDDKAVVGSSGPDRVLGTWDDIACISKENPAK
jgi:hypothetical protein